MVFDKNMLIQKEDMIIKKKDTIIKEDIRNVTNDNVGYAGVYRENISPFIERFKNLIKDSSSGEIELKIKDIKNMMGDEFKDRDVTSFYMMLKVILIESGIKIRLHHWYGANVILSFAPEGEVKSSIEIVRERMLKSAKNAGYDRYADYARNLPSHKKKYSLNIYNKEDKHYFVYIGRKYIAKELFPNAIINWDVMTNRYTGDKGGYDWISDGLKIKHLASTIRHRADIPKVLGREGFERDIFQWGIANNNRADAFILTAWDDSTNLDLMKAWIFGAHEIVNGKEFWDRSSFLISTHKRSILKYSKFEINDDKLEHIRRKIRDEKQINVTYEDVVDYKLEIADFYSTIFRTVNWEVKGVDKMKKYETIERLDKPDVDIFWVKQ
jgi:hypothetical protein